MGGRGSSSMSGGGAAWKKQTIYEQARAIAETEVPANSGEGYLLADRISEWALNKKIDDGSISSSMATSIWNNTADVTIERETEKAYRMKAESDYGTEHFWMPKTWLQSAEKMRAGDVREAASTIVSANYSAYLKATAKANGVKIGSVKKFSTIVKKLKSAGIDVPSKYDWSNTKGYQVKSAKELGWK